MREIVKEKERKGVREQELYKKRERASERVREREREGGGGKRSERRGTR